MRIAGAIFTIAIVVIGIAAGVAYFTRSQGTDISGSKTGSGSFGVFRSDDGGTSWKAASALDPEGSFSRFEVKEFVPHPQNPLALYAITSGGIFLSENRGETWKALSDAAGVLDPRGRANRIAVDFRDPQRLVVLAFQAGQGRVLRSTDGGAHFEQVYMTAVSKVDLAALAMDPENPNVLYVGASDGLLLQSEDFGTSWKTVNQFSAAVTHIAVPPRARNALYVVLAKRGLWKSPDFGATWEDLNSKFMQFFRANEIEAIALDPRDPGRLFLGTVFGLVRSDDGGATFTAPPLVIPARSLPVLGIALDPVSSRRFHVSASNALYTTDDGGEHWQQRQIAEKGRIGALFVDAEDPSIIYAGMRK